MTRTARWLAVLAGFAAAAPAASARAEVYATVHPSFMPDALGASAALTLAFRISGGEEGVPPAVSRVVAHLPAGLGVHLLGLPTCAAARLRRGGPAGCPPRSLVGRGHATVEVHAGSQAIAEEASVWALLGPGRGGPVLEILSRGVTPLEEQTLSSGVLGADQPPYGSKLTMSVPPIPTIVYEPDGSIITFSLTIGGAGAAHGASGAISVPAHCPAGGFPFGLDFAFSDGTSTSVAAHVPCP